MTREAAAQIQEAVEQTNQSKADAFVEKMLGIFNGSAIALMTSIGHRTGLFDTMSSLSPSTPAEIALAAGLNERYAHGWLGAISPMPVSRAWK